MKKFTLVSLVFAGLLFTSCEEQSLVPDDQRNPDNRNIEAWIYTYWGTEGFSTDSVYDLSDAQISIESVRLVMSDYNFSLSTGDTVDADTSYTVAKLPGLKHKIGLLPGGSYTGEHQITVGYDSSSYFMPYDEAPEILMADGIRRGNQGFNHLVIKGKYRLPEDTVNLEPHLDFEYRLGGQDFNVQFERPMSFSVTANNPVAIFFNFDIQMLFQGGLSPAIIEEIKSDPNDNTDYLAATLLYMNLEQSLTLD